MTRKYYKMIAGWLLCLQGQMHDQACEKHCHYIADDLARDNANFNRSKFLESCGCHNG